MDNLLTQLWNTNDKLSILPRRRAQWKRSTTWTPACSSCSPTNPDSASSNAPGFPPNVDLAAMGYTLTGFAVLEIAQGRRIEVIERLVAIDEVCEAHSTTGRGDLLVRVVATSNADLQRVIEEVVNVPYVERTSTSIALTTPIQYRTRPLLERVAKNREFDARATEFDARSARSGEAT